MGDVTVVGTTGPRISDNGITMGKGNDPNCISASLSQRWLIADTEDDLQRQLASDADGGRAVTVPESTFATMNLQQWVQDVHKALEDPWIGELINGPEPEGSDMRAVREALIDVRTAAVYAARVNMNTRLDSLLLQRRLRVLAIATARAENPRILVSKLSSLLLTPCHSPQQRQMAVAFFTYDEQLTAPHLAQKLRMIPPGAGGALFEVAELPGSGCPLDEALVLFHQLSQISTRLQVEAASLQAHTSRRFSTLYRQRLGAALRQLHGELVRTLEDLDLDKHCGPVTVQADRQDLRTLLAVSELASLSYGDGRESLEQIDRAERTGRICVDAIRELNDLREFDAGLLPTFSRSEFEILFPAHVDASKIRGAYIPHLETVVLSPGHAQVLCDPFYVPSSPDDAGLLMPVHLHELAHASASNAAAAQTCPVEAALAEGYAEVIVHSSLGEVERRLSADQQRPVGYEPADPYPLERRMMGEIVAAMEMNGGPDGEFNVMRRFSEAPSMTGLIARWLHMRHLDSNIDDVRDRARRAMDAYLTGDPGPLRALLSRPAPARRRDARRDS